MRSPQLQGLLCAALLVAGGAARAAGERAPDHRPVKAVADQRLEVRGAGGAGRLPLYASRPLDGDAVQADVERAVLVFHGRLRNADTYWRSAQKALAAVPGEAPRTLLVVPQFLAQRDAEAWRLPPDTLRWTLEGWEGGEAARAPQPVSSFEAIDAILGVLADRRRFPNLRQVVLAGHSGGGQVVQRYAVVGQGEARLAARGVAVRYVVANPSSYLYFDAARPRPADPAQCPAVNRWKYGWDDAPPYATQSPLAVDEARYLARDVVYLLGALDVDPQQPALDKSCAAEAQGPDRLARGRAYVAALALRHPGFAPAVHEVPGVGHDGDRMLGSACGLAALFDDERSRQACR